MFNFGVCSRSCAIDFMSASRIIAICAESVDELR